MEARHHEESGEARRQHGQREYSRSCDKSWAKDFHRPHNRNWMAEGPNYWQPGWAADWNRWGSRMQCPVMARWHQPADVNIRMHVGGFPAMNCPVFNGGLAGCPVMGRANFGRGMANCPVFNWGAAGYKARNCPLFGRPANAGGKCPVMGWGKTHHSSNSEDEQKTAKHHHEEKKEEKQHEQPPVETQQPKEAQTDNHPAKAEACPDKDCCPKVDEHASALFHSWSSKDGKIKEHLTQLEQWASKTIAFCKDKPVCGKLKAKCYALRDCCHAFAAHVDNDEPARVDEATRKILRKCEKIKQCCHRIRRQALHGWKYAEQQDKHCPKSGASHCPKELMKGCPLSVLEKCPVMKEKCPLKLLLACPVVQQCPALAGGRPVQPARRCPVQQPGCSSLAAKCPAFASGCPFKSQGQSPDLRIGGTSINIEVRDNSHAAAFGCPFKQSPAFASFGAPNWQGHHNKSSAASKADDITEIVRQRCPEMLNCVNGLAQCCPALNPAGWNSSPETAHAWNMMGQCCPALNLQGLRKCPEFRKCPKFAQVSEEHQPKHAGKELGKKEESSGSVGAEKKADPPGQPAAPAETHKA